MVIQQIKICYWGMGERWRLHDRGDHEGRRYVGVFRGFDGGVVSIHDDGGCMTESGFGDGTFIHDDGGFMTAATARVAAT